MHVQKTFEVPVVYTIIPQEIEAHLNTDGLVTEQLEDVIVIPITCDVMDCPRDCEQLDKVIAREDKNMNLYNILIKKIAASHGVDAESVNLIEARVSTQA